MNKKISDALIKRVQRMSVSELKEIKALVNFELDNKTGNEVALAAFRNKVNSIFLKYERDATYIDRLKEVAEYTEEEFSKFRGMGKKAMAAAKKELAGNYLTFKQNTINPKG